MAVNLPLQSLATYKNADWFFSDDPGLPDGSFVGEFDCGYYVHQNRLYLAGLVANGNAIGGTYNTVTTEILSGLPPDLSPAEDTALTLYAYLSGLENPGAPIAPIPITLAATITAAGTLNLDELPPYINDIPGGTQLTENTGGSGTEPDFVYPALYPLLLGNVSWLIDVDEADEPFWTDLDPYVSAGADFDNIDAQYALHNSRLHLRGTVRAKRIYASDLAEGIPPAMVAAITAEKGAITNIGGPSFAPQLAVSQAELSLAVIQDDAGGTVPQQPPLQWHNPTDGELAFDVLFDYTTPPTSFVAGLRVPQTHGDIPPSEWGAPVDIGRRQVAVETSASETLTSDGSFSIVNTTAADQIASFTPTPDYVAVLVRWWDDSGTSFIFDGTGTSGALTIGISGSGTELIDAAGDLFSGESSSGDIGWPNPPLVIHRLTDPVYTKDPYNRGQEMLFTPDEASSLAVTLGAGPVASGTATLDVLVVPFYELRTDWIETGDVLDLAGAGWYADYTDPPLATTVAAGPGVSGIVPLSQPA